MMSKIIAAVSAAIQEFIATKDFVATINNLLTAIFGTVAEEEGIDTYPVA